MAWERLATHDQEHAWLLFTKRNLRVLLFLVVVVMMFGASTEDSFIPVNINKNWRRKDTSIILFKMEQLKDAATKGLIYFFLKCPFRSLVNYIKEKGVKEQCGGIPDRPIKW